MGVDLVGDINTVGDIVGDIIGEELGGLMKKFDTCAATSLILLAPSLFASPIGFPL